MNPAPGGILADLNTMLADQNFVMLAHLAKGPQNNLLDPVTLNELVECDFPGYAPVRMNRDLSNAFENEWMAEMSPQHLEFVVLAIAQPQMVTHIYYTKVYDGGAPLLISAVPFDTPINVYYPGQKVEFEAVIFGTKDS